MHAQWPFAETSGRTRVSTWPVSYTHLCIGVATIAAAIGAGGLGVFIFRGVAMASNPVILAGAIPAAVLAVAADLLLGLLERRLTPRQATRE